MDLVTSLGASVTDSRLCSEPETCLDRCSYSAAQHPGYRSGAKNQKAKHGGLYYLRHTNLQAFQTSALPVSLIQQNRRFLQCINAAFLDSDNATTKNASARFLPGLLMSPRHPSTMDLPMFPAVASARFH